MVTQFLRQTAVPCTLFELKNGVWMQNDGLVPSGVKTIRGTISRVNTIGVMIDKSEGAFSIDDGTSIIRVRSFDTPAPTIYASIGDLVLVVGRPREYNNERFLVLEIVKRLRNPAWIQYRKKELELLSGVEIYEMPIVDDSVAFTPVAHKVEVPISSTKNPFELLIEKIRELDSGSGADIEEVIATLKIDGAEKYVRTLIDEGEIFETKPGRVKVLE